MVDKIAVTRIPSVFFSFPPFLPSPGNWAGEQDSCCALAWYLSARWSSRRCRRCVCCAPTSHVSQHANELLGNNVASATYGRGQGDCSACLSRLHAARLRFACHCIWMLNSGAAATPAQRCDPIDCIKYLPAYARMHISTYTHLHDLACYNTSKAYSSTTNGICYHNQRHLPPWPMAFANKIKGICSRTLRHLPPTPKAFAFTIEGVCLHHGIDPHMYTVTPCMLKWHLPHKQNGAFARTPKTGWTQNQ